MQISNDPFETIFLSCTMGSERIRVSWKRLYKYYFPRSLSNIFPHNARYLQIYHRPRDFDSAELLCRAMFTKYIYIYIFVTSVTDYRLLLSLLQTSKVVIPSNPTHTGQTFPPPRPSLYPHLDPPE